mmetsp:Transcript_20249/g.47276  ORF Transcript_20249/g.47276 Transcript_20249/m.47276 type:complete len:480 (-) Transcript_20249:74-1513(-)
MAVVKALPPAETLTTIDPAILCGDRPLPPITESGCPSELRQYVVLEDPRMLVVPQFITQAEADHLVALAEGNWLPSLVGKIQKKDGEAATNPVGPQERPQKAQSSTRTSWSCMLRPAQTAIVQRIEHRCAKLAGLPPSQLERLAMVRYAPGEYFNQHHDGGFRPITIFIYLNELEQEDMPAANAEQTAAGDTFFPTLGLSFVPRPGCAVMWPNSLPDGSIDNRMLHAGRPPRKGVKYGVNCFFNVEEFRLICQPQLTKTPADADLVDLGKLNTQACEAGKLQKLVLTTQPKVVAVRAFASEAEVSHLLSLVGSAQNGTASSSKPSTLRVIEMEEDQVVKGLELRLAAVAGVENTDNLGCLRVIRSATSLGESDRTIGWQALVVCLEDYDEVYFPKLNLLIGLHRGDLLSWPNQYWHETTLQVGEDPDQQQKHLRATEDLRTARVHIPRGASGQPARYMEGFCHDRSIRAHLREAAGTQK